MATVLIAEDDASVARLLQRLLTDQGHTVLVARNGLEALAALDTNHIDLVIADLQLPLLDGASLVQLIRAMPSGPRLVVISGNLRSPRLAATVRAADAALPKPLHIPTLERTIDRMVSA